MENKISSAVRKVYTEKVISLGTFFGGPLAAAILISKNYRTFGKDESARNALYLGVILSLLLFLVLLLLPVSNFDKILNISLPLVFTGTVYFIIHKYQKKEIEEYLINGAPKASAWEAFGIGIMCSTIYLMIIIPAARFSNPDFDYNKYDNYVTTFVNNEQAALYIYYALQVQTTEKVIPITTESIYLWKKNIEVVELMDAIVNLPGLLKDQNKLLFKYCNLRIEELSLIKQALIEDTNEYDSKILNKQKEIETVLTKLEAFE